MYFGKSGDTGGKTTELPVCIAVSVDETYCVIDSDDDITLFAPAVIMK